MASHRRGGRRWRSCQREIGNYENASADRLSRVLDYCVSHERDRIYRHFYVTEFWDICESLW
uniref:Uncharacterized protein n=1 Tax=Helianthus annuus TaxID=4232 RepID=A0A251S534_HELAN